MPGTRPNPVRAAHQWAKALEHEFDALTDSNARWSVGGLQRCAGSSPDPILREGREERNVAVASTAKQSEVEAL